MVFDRKEWSKQYRLTEKGKEAWLRARRRYLQTHKDTVEFKTKTRERGIKYRLANAEKLKERRRQYYLKRKERDPDFMIRYNERHRIYYLKNKDNPEFQAREKAKVKRYYAKVSQTPEYMAKVRERVRKRWREMSFEKRQLHNLPRLKYRHKIREAIFHKLGQYWCQRCGEHDRRCLQLDHINGGGVQEIKRISKAHNRDMTAIYSYYLGLENIHEHLMVLCSNCNWKKRFEKRENGKYVKPFILPQGVV